MDYNNPNMPPPNYGQPGSPPSDDVTRGKTVAILSYCFLLGWIIAIILHQSDKTKFGAYHLRQGLGLHLCWIGAAIVLFIIGLMIWVLLPLIPVLHLGGLTLVVISIINTSNGKMNPVPLIGKMSENIFSGIQ